MYVTPYRISWIIFTSDLVITLYRKIVGIPMGTNCAPLVADLFLFCYETDFMSSLSDDNQADIIAACIKLWGNEYMIFHGAAHM